MPSMSRIILLALHAAAFIAFSGLPRTTIYAVASPLPAPIATTGYPHAKMDSAHGSRTRNDDSQSIRHKHDAMAHPPTAPTFTARAQPSSDSSHHQRDTDILASLLGYYGAAKQNSGNLKKLAAQSASAQNHGDDFQMDCASQLTDFSANLLGFQTAFAKANGAGLANYDRSNQLETLLKDTINVNKDVLSSVSVLTYNIPGLGPILGPIVYEIKCVLEQVLDYCENLADALINALQELCAQFGKCGILGICLHL